MSTEQNVAIMRRWFEEVWNQGDYRIVDEFVVPSSIAHGLGEDGGDLVGTKDILAFLKAFREAFPDIKMSVDDAFGADDRVAVRWSAVMTHTGDTLGIPPTHERMEVEGTTIGLIKDGKLIEGWNHWDRTGLMHALQSAAKK